MKVTTIINTKHSLINYTHFSVDYNIFALQRSAEVQRIVN